MSITGAPGKCGVGVAMRRGLFCACFALLEARRFPAKKPVGDLLLQSADLSCWISGRALAMGQDTNITDTRQA